jgi:chemotaxis family two-component system response regulator Rcp1
MDLIEARQINRGERSPAAAFAILLVENNPGDVRLSVAADGVEAMAFLRREGKHAHAPRPDLILLDLNMPRKDGREVLAEIKADPDLRRIPVVILTMSTAEKDILESYDLHANCYIAKPVDLDQFLGVVQSIGEFWLATVRLPPNGTD